ncbi:MAG: cadherin-like beta sandwich domain-containing protein, partial [Defluviitaleaceae bacterium]|nr:cadherin-like beta sandwich domain-containing protein [Defluviitaleaceae bacterium]
DLTVNPGTLAPAFDPAVTEYTVSVDNSVASIDIEAAASDANAEITGDTGSQNLAEGANTFTVTVTAEDGVTQIIYTVTVTRAAAPAYDAKYDINGDGKIDAADLALIMANLNKKASSSAVAKKCDLDGDGMVTMMDYQMLAAYIASL